MSTRMKEMQSRRKIASVTNGLTSSPSGGTAMPMNTSAATARVPWPPIQVRARTGSPTLFFKLKGIQYCSMKRRGGATMRQPQGGTKSLLVTLCCQAAETYPAPSGKWYLVLTSDAIDYNIQHHENDDRYRRSDFARGQGHP